MKGEKSLYDIPFRYGGIFHNYDRDWDEWKKNLKKPMACYCCGSGGNQISNNGKLLRRNYPYAAFFKFIGGKYKGYTKLKILCRACAYNYGKGVVEMDGETYHNPREFNERKYKLQRKEELKK